MLLFEGKQDQCEGEEVFIRKRPRHRQVECNMMKRERRLTTLTDRLYIRHFS